MRNNFIHINIIKFMSKPDFESKTLGYAGHLPMIHDCIGIPLREAY